ncbi:unnamed protein product [Cuscuta epithymum]|uniref:Protein XRI1 n=1 Tax=Cuscuta epithymum TaxID=186058 RepID=A0AAV0GEW2_9ASTE|nr:unnamed protein product [Cuscuta epithymum]
MSNPHGVDYSTATISSFRGGGGSWDLAAVNPTFFPSPGIENTPPCFSDMDSDDLSTGYLEDALFNYNAKRRKKTFLLFDDDDQGPTDLNILWSCLDDGNIKLDYCYENYDNLREISKCDHISDMKRKPDAEAISAFAAHSDSSLSSSSKCYNNIQPPPSVDSPSFSAAGSDGVRRPRKRATAKLVYPFAVVKPGGTEGDVTLNDINERILMPPTRPVKHPVGDFACRRRSSPVGTGLSGKAVVALTRIQTRGRGTITIMRTRG